MTITQRTFELFLEIIRSVQLTYNTLLLKQLTSNYDNLNNHNIQIPFNFNEWSIDRQTFLLTHCEIMITDISMQSIPWIWCYYIQLLIQTTNYKQAKQLFYRASRKCSLTKKFWTFIWSDLSRVFSPKELADIEDVIHEKGIFTRFS